MRQNNGRSAHHRSPIPLGAWECQSEIAHAEGRRASPWLSFFLKMPCLRPSKGCHNLLLEQIFGGSCDSRGLNG